jgi:hypothetical protein
MVTGPGADGVRWLTCARVPAAQGKRVQVEFTRPWSKEGEKKNLGTRKTKTQTPEARASAAVVSGPGLCAVQTDPGL